MDQFSQQGDNWYFRWTRLTEEPSGLTQTRKDEMHKIKSPAEDAVLAHKIPVPK